MGISAEHLERMIAALENQMQQAADTYQQAKGGLAVCHSLLEALHKEEAQKDGETVS